MKDKAKISKSWEFQKSTSLNIPIDVGDSNFMDDGESPIDYILLWIKSKFVTDNHQEKIRSAYRKCFEENLRSTGLKLEITDKENANDCIYFLKIHLPTQVLLKYAEKLNFKIPIKTNQTTDISEEADNHTDKCINNIFYNNKQFPSKPRLYKAFYSENRKFLFDTTKNDLILPRQRSFIVQYILEKAKFGTNPIDYGLQRLLAERAYDAAFSLHDGDLRQEGTMRHKLNKHWASMKNWYQLQPLDYITDYFGSKIGLYFAWLEFYNLMLVIASVIGVGTFVFSVLTVNWSDEANKICMSNITMCSYNEDSGTWPLSDSCFYSKLSYVTDNCFTVIYAIFMSLWAVTLLEFWKRRQARLQYNWSLSDLTHLDQPTRPSYYIQAGIGTDKIKVSYVKRKLPARCFSIATIFFFILLAIASTISIIIYRTVTSHKFSKMLPMYGNTVTMLSSAFINLAIIITFNVIYGRLARKLTDFELHRTQIDYDDALTLKIYAFKFVNYYGTLFYIAFFKNNLGGDPKKYTRLFNIRQEQCHYGGCLSELTIQLLIIFGLKQIFGQILEYSIPKIKIWWNKRKLSNEDFNVKWIDEWKLGEFRTQGLLPEYLEMVIQFGFVTLFCIAFPLAPLLALLNNIIEVRVDAKKLIRCYRRVITEDVKDIGIWYGILDWIVKISGLVNGLIIAFTSDFIPKLAYTFIYSKDESYDSYIQFSLSSVQKDYYDGNITSECMYYGYRESEPPYNHKRIHYEILLWKFVFVILFQNMLWVVTMFIRWFISDVPSDIQLKIKEDEKYLEEILQQNLQEQIKRVSDNSRILENFNEILDQQESGSQNHKDDASINGDITQHASNNPENHNLDHFDSNLNVNSSIKNIQDTIYQKTDGIFPNDLREKINEVNVEQLTTTLNEIADLVEDVNTETQNN
uniref:Anoctamin n=1 Tax=Culicoides sonorensis TaxID=179676 RepID=A0A336K6N3_CULSO